METGPLLQKHIYIAAIIIIIVISYDAPNNFTSQEITQPSRLLSSFSLPPFSLS